MNSDHVFLCLDFETFSIFELEARPYGLAAKNFAINLVHHANFMPKIIKTLFIRRIMLTIGCSRPTAIHFMRILKWISVPILNTLAELGKVLIERTDKFLTLECFFRAPT